MISLTSVVHSTVTFIEGSIWPGFKKFLGTVVHDEINALAPFAQSVAAELAADLAANAGNLAEFAAVAGKVLAGTAAQAEAAAVVAGGGALLAAVSGAIADHVPQADAGAKPAA